MNLRIPGIALLVTLATALGCGGNTPQRPRACQADAECPSGAYCLGGACVAGLLPEARIAVVGTGRELVSHRLVEFDGSASIDPNPQHRLTGYRWAVKRASAAACDASPTSGDADKLSTIFRCAGDYQVELTVKNSLGLESAPIAQAIAVSPSANAPAIDAQSPDLALGHRCAAAGCEAVDGAGQTAFQLSVTAHDVEDGLALSYRWQVDAPAGADPAAAAFEPDASSANPIVRIRSASGRIAGVWTFRVLVTDGDQLTTPAEIRLAVDDQLPTVTPEMQVAAFDHTFGENVYRVHGLVRYAVADAEGDAVQATSARVVESQPTGCRATLTPVPKPGAIEVTLDLSCVSADELSPTMGGQALGAGVLRQLALTVSDGQGGEATSTLPLEIRDNLPALALATVTTDHATAPCPFPSGRCFTAAGSVPAALDPDGDPAQVVAYQARGVDGHAGWSSDGAGAFTLLADLAYPTSFRAADGTSPVGLTVTVRDPWRSADVPLALAIPNRPPVGTGLAPWVVAGYDGARYLVTGEAAAFVDPDGDPFGAPQASEPACAVALSGAGSLTATCGTAFAWTGNAAPALGAFLAAPWRFAVTAADPWQRGAPATATLQPVAPRAPTLASLSASLPHTCRRVCPVGEPCDYLPNVTCATTTYQPPVVSAVPVQVQVTASTGESAWFDCFGGACTASLQFSCAATQLTVWTSDGASTPSAFTVALVADCP